MRSQMQKQKAACEAKCSFSGTGKKGVIITPIDNQLYFFFGMTLSLYL